MSKTTHKQLFFGHDPLLTASFQEILTTNFNHKQIVRNLLFKLQLQEVASRNKTRRKKNDQIAQKNKT
jgi:hypothetical protein